ncbi:MAG: uroporphyrinogen decarboxylase family protein [Actinomycetota bacterium]|nr:uroporphyrinogen decarboxylase family protein [Actinomycetota bacterium]
MSGRERILAVLKGEIPDKVPVGLFVQEEYLAWFFPKKKEVDRVIDAVECSRILEFDLLARDRTFETPYFMKKSYPNWEVDEEIKTDGGNMYRIIKIGTPEGTLQQIEAAPYEERIISGIHFSTIEYLIKNSRDFEAFSKFVPGIDSATLIEMRERAAFSKKIIGELGLSVPWGWGGVFNQAATYRDIQELLVDAYLNYEFYQAYMDKMAELIVENNTALADTDFQCIGIQGNIANSAMVGAEFFDKYILPYEKRLVQAIKDAGKFTLYHNCGKAKVLQKSYIKMGLDVWETVAPSPQGDNDLKEAKELIGDSIVLSGNIDQVNFLKKASLKEIEDEVTRIMSIGKPGGRYIFAASDYLEKGTPLENVKKVIEVARREGKY